MITRLQRAVARAFFALPDSAGFAVAGGAALIARGLVDRQTKDVDVFTPAPPAAPIPHVVAAYERSLAECGWAARRIHVSATFARLVVEAGDESLVVNIGVDSPPDQPPTMTELGPTLAAHDLAARKTLALFGRAEARDFTDVYALARHFGKEQLLRWAGAQDSGFDLRVFADMIGTMRRFTDEDLLLAHPDADRVRTFFATWREEILAGDAATPPPTPAGPR